MYSNDLKSVLEGVVSEAPALNQDYIDDNLGALGDLDTSLGTIKTSLDEITAAIEALTVVLTPSTGG